LFKDVDDSTWPQNGNFLLAKEHTASINWHDIHLFFFTRSLCPVLLFPIERTGAGKTFVVYQIILTVDNSAQVCDYECFCCALDI